jgi:hypothetical protein
MVRLGLNSKVKHPYVMYPPIPPLLPTIVVSKVT